MAKITLKKDHTIEFKQGAFAPRIIGEWRKEDIWAQNGGKRDKSGNKLVHFIYYAILRRGLELQEYTRTDLVKTIKKYY